MNTAYNAMLFARKVHFGHLRKYTNTPYIEHLAEVVAIASSVGLRSPGISPNQFMAVCWLHDCFEDRGVKRHTLVELFGETVANGVLLLSDMETGNRAERKAASRARLALAPAWVQTIKVADLISNTSSIAQYDPRFAMTYLPEKALMLDVLTGADERLVALAREQVAA